ncbi:MAG TPA: hypothetical protein VFH66_08685 [Mycobacteriales bacterium]|nr:hypothetical protein [Mycobacteriales bacterium]
MRMPVKLAAVAVTTVTALGATAGAANAYDCFNASRSAQGDVSAAANSGNWWSVPEILSALAGLSPDQVDQVMAVVNQDPRVPANFTVFLNPAHVGELATNMRADLATNGKGIDHSDDYPTPVFDALIEDVFIGLGGS